MRGLALAMVVANAGSIASGAAVRLSQSGLGCPTWPECTRQSLVASSSADSSLVHAWIEFGNRLFVTLIMIVAVLVFVAAWRLTRGAGQPEGTPRPGRGLFWLAAVQPAGVLLQAVLGGIVVLTKLDPATVSIHFLVSIAVLGAAVALHAWFADPARPPGVTVRGDLRWLSAGLVAVTGLMLAAGTVVTGTGPLAGAASVPRYHLPLEGVTQFHADIGWLLGGLAVATAVALRYAGPGSRAGPGARAGPPPGAARRAWLLFGLILTQGAVGYAQYFSGLPAGLVWVHVLGATLIWIAALRLFFLLHPVLPVLRAQAARPAAERFDTDAAVDGKW